MEKLLSKITDKFAEKLFAQNMSTSLISTQHFSKHETANKTLVSYVKYLNKINDIENDLAGINFGIRGMYLTDELSDVKVRKIAYELALAVDNNSAVRVKELKQKYKNCKEFVKAKDFLNDKCKILWDVYNQTTGKINIPHEAMKVLGISNRPSLEDLLSNSIKFFEKDEGSSTVKIINSILQNENMNYNMADIYKFLKTFYEKEHVKYNCKTVEYLILEQKYSPLQLKELGVTQEILKNVFKQLNLKNKIRFVLKKICSI